ncbi:uncharacterized protein LOC143858543 [Tasmannia lanceolata]|uniref:uncharacterized protein LOC143858543 n=1 Tax=Tasmannia lanceolata TaxID=3420 RepID=UPI0040632E8C
MASKGNETANAEGMKETKVETVDYQKSAGQETVKKDVEVIHQPQQPTGGETGASAVAKGIQSAKDTVAKGIQSAKDAVSSATPNTKGCNK